MAPAPVLIATFVGGIVGVRFLGYRELMPMRMGFVPADAGIVR